MRTSFLAFAAALALSSASAQLNLEMSALTGQGRAIRLRASLPEPVTAPLLLRAYQIQCAPDCRAVGLFPDAASGRDQIVVEQAASGGGSLFSRFFFPHGALANPGVYSSLARQDEGGRADLTMTRTGVPGIQAPTVLPDGATGAPFSTAFSAGGGSGP